MTSQQPPWEPPEQPGSQQPFGGQQWPQHQPGQQQPYGAQPWQPARPQHPTQLPGNAGGLPAKPPKKPHRKWNIVLAIVGGFIVLGAINNALGANKTPPSKPTAAATPKAAATSPDPVATTAAAAATTAPAIDSTARAVVTWYHNGGKTALDAIENDLNTIYTDTQAGNYSAVGQDCAQVGTDVTNAQALGPVPYPRAEKWMARALAKYSEAAAECQAGVSSQDASAIEEGNTDMGQGTADIDKAVEAINALDNSLG